MNLLINILKKILLLILLSNNTLLKANCNYVQEQYIENESLQIADLDIGSFGPAKGIIFLEPFSSENNSNLYFEVAPKNTEVQKIWQNNPVIHVDNIGTLIGLGGSNTQHILNARLFSISHIMKYGFYNGNKKNIAAEYCDNLKTQKGLIYNKWELSCNKAVVFDDWYLPSYDEFYQLTNIINIEAEEKVINDEIQSLKGKDYWTSSQYGIIEALTINFKKNEIISSSSSKSEEKYVRCIRSFKLNNIN